MNAINLIKSISSLVEQKVPTFLWGSTGIGKSSIVKQIAKNANIDFIDLRLALMDPTDLKGIPYFDKENSSAAWASPNFLPRDGEGILFLDELNSAPPSVQASAYQLILDRQVGEYKLPDGWAIISAGNRESDRGVTYRMPSPLANRFVHLEMEVSVDDWKLWAYENTLDENIISYISFKNEHLFTFNASLDAKSFATPRSWEYVDKILKTNIDKSLLLDIISGAISKEVAVEFLSFLKVKNKLPDIEKILNEKIYEYPTDVDVLYALSTGLVSAYLSSKSSDRLENLITYSLDLQSEFAVMLIQDLQKLNIDMQRSKAFAQWVKKFAYLL